MASRQKSVLITGCSVGGIGEGLAEVFHERGYHVFATVRNLSRASETLSNASNVTILILDVLSSESIAAAVESVSTKTGGRLDILINNSAGGWITPALDVSIEEGKKLFDLNFWAPLAMLQAFSPLLIEAKGCLVNNTSGSAYTTMPFMSKSPRQISPLANNPGIYNGSKAALISAGETWRHELQPLGVRTITLITCPVKTNCNDGFKLAKLSETSNYFEIQDFMNTIADGHLHVNAVSPRQYALQVIQRIEEGTVGIVWAGTDPVMSRFAWWLFPQWVFVSFESPRVLNGCLIEIAGHDIKEYPSFPQGDGQIRAKEEDFLRETVVYAYDCRVLL